MNKIYLIAYDLHTPGKSYNDLYGAIKNYSDWRHPLESMWFIYTNQDLESIYQNLRKHIDDNDNIYIQQVSKDIQEQGWLPKTFWTWLQNKRNDD